jgi:Na+/H+ antiporter NhaD/arsenite permease-like protein
MNDTLAIVGTPLMLYMASRSRVDSRPLLMALAFAITIGSVASPIGNPQNLLIAVKGGVENPFLTFASHLLVPTVINLFIAYLWLKWVYGKEFAKPIAPGGEEAITDARLAMGCRLALGIIIILVGAKIVLVTAGTGLDFPLTLIALSGAAPVILASRDRAGLLWGVDWGTLAFFATMFVLMGAVWSSGGLQSLIYGTDLDLLLIPVILLVSVLLSQVMSNVPLVALYLPVLIGMGAGTLEMMALAAGSTVAGNLLIIGAASNVIIIQSAERHRRRAFGFLEFARVGAPLTLLNVLVYWLFLGL